MNRLFLKEFMSFTRRLTSQKLKHVPIVSKKYVSNNKKEYEKKQKVYGVTTRKQRVDSLW